MMRIGLPFKFRPQQHFDEFPFRAALARRASTPYEAAIGAISAYYFSAAM